MCVRPLYMFIDTHIHHHNNPGLHPSTYSVELEKNLYMNSRKLSIVSQVMKVEILLWQELMESHPHYLVFS